ncbi:hypothetical protein JAB5_03300 [Janthinobacterium sp. HH103]|uniref:hypothetical protein n=1 Tax=unclassified Janthinobacterium TaxID=2610881 RepID=UPI000875269E|nr:MULTISPECIES: hypothetical protein [unclassified Janthinobacterium]OEZ60221.1 hypothetical protein JAB2_45660 [Janthinobacterium sp. HH100]OEZ87539.1 hypothetical protein JAB5_03300 [Janthinobacterium sp. HH103]OFA07314.1 hypothetical protein JAB9_06520 [Janthinobacterium sp. HH107]QOU72010.1 hypothetical protein JAB4_014340 [Janthinobacterium sp. HH102]
MPNWTSPPQLVALAAFYARAQAHPETISDAAFLEAVKAAHWPTNCWSYVEASFAIIAPACLLRPHLTAGLIVFPIDAMIAGGLDDAGQVIAIGRACATRDAPYVEVSEEGKRWLTQVWPGLDELIGEVFAARLRAALADDEE